MSIEEFDDSFLDMFFPPVNPLSDTDLERWTDLGIAWRLEEAVMLIHGLLPDDEVLYSCPRSWTTPLVASPNDVDTLPIVKKLALISGSIKRLGWGSETSTRIISVLEMAFGASVTALPQNRLGKVSAQKFLSWASKNNLGVKVHIDTLSDNLRRNGGDALIKKKGRKADPAQQALDRKIHTKWKCDGFDRKRLAEFFGLEESVIQKSLARGCKRFGPKG